VDSLNYMESFDSEWTTNASTTTPVAASPFPFASFDPAYAEPHDHRILVVDDEEAVRNLYASYLNETYSCATASDAQMALELMAGEQFALVLSDMQMPGLSGIELLRKIVERYPDTAVIMISVVDRTQRVIDAIRVGASDYLVKPCELDVLSLCIERALERRALLRNARRYKRDLEQRNLELAKQKAELVRLQAQMAQAEKMASLGLLAAGVAHELNNPAGFINSNVDVLKDYVGRLAKCLRAYDAMSLTAGDAALVAELKEQIDYENIMSDLDSTLSDTYIGAERIRDVVKNLRLFSRLDEAEIKRVDLHEGLEATIRLLSSFFKSGRITVSRDYGDLPLVTCYAAQLNQVWMNLLANAAQAIGDDEGTVHIQSRCDGDRVTISISDTGKGISEENIKKIFDPFFTTKPIGEGTGLGLSITHGIIVQHHGTIDIKSAAGKGTTFVITLPIDIEPRPDE
jgi:two-component system, NtrC family, sensor kinase